MSKKKILDKAVSKKVKKQEEEKVDAEAEKYFQKHLKAEDSDEEENEWEGGEDFELTKKPGQDYEDLSDEDYDDEVEFDEEVDFDEQFEEEEEDEEEDEQEVEEEEEGKVEGESNEVPVKKEKEPRNVVRKEAKELRDSRKGQDKNFDLVSKCKSLWEVIRSKETEPKVRQESLSKLMALLKGKVKDLIFKHDSSRIIQTMLKFGNADQCLSIGNELKGCFIDLSKSKYSRFIVSKILKYCPKLKAVVIKEFEGKIGKLIKHKEAANVIDDIYVLYANAQEKSLLVEEFYGPQFKLACLQKTKRPSLNEVLKGSPEKAPLILAHLKNCISSILDKGTSNLAIVHRIILEYIQNVGEKEIQDLVFLMKDQIVEMVHTMEGSMVTIMGIAYSNAKERKGLVKSLKPFLMKIAKEQYGHVVLMTILSCLDDTALVSKVILSELMQNIKDLLCDPFGSRVLLFILTDAKRYHSSGVLQKIQKAEEASAGISKKPKEVKRQELFDYCKEYFITSSVEIFETLRLNQYGSEILLEVLLAFPDQQNLADCLKFSFSKTDDLHPFVEKNSQSMLKRLMQKNNSSLYCQEIFDAIKGDLMKWIEHSAFLVLTLLNTQIGDQVCSAIKKHQKKLEKTIKVDENTPKALILKKISQ